MGMSCSHGATVSTTYDNPCFCFGALLAIFFTKSVDPEQGWWRNHSLRVLSKRVP